MERTIEVTGCDGCPFYRPGGYTMYCGHPALKTEAEAHIIHRDYLHTVPPLCPLRAGEIVTTIKLRSK